MAGEGTIMKTEENTLLCYECARFHKPEDMQAYDCCICGGRKSLTFHTTEDNFRCDVCGTSNLCNDCLAFTRCCDSYHE